VKRDLLSLLICPECRCTLDAYVTHIKGDEVIEGALVCSSCGADFPITRGIPRFVQADLTPQQKATAAAFGYEWTHYSQLTDADRKEFLAWISPLTPEDFKDRVVLDAGCGKGRHICLASQFGARAVVGIDLSDAVEAAYQNTRHIPNVHVIQADIGKLPLANRFDLVYSIGVLHHLPVPKDGFLALTRYIKPGGRLSFWVYGKEGNGWIEKLVDPVRKHVTSRLPKAITQWVSWIPAIPLYAALKLLYRPARHLPWLKRLLPYSDYLCSISDYSFAENLWNVFDQLVAPTTFYHSRNEVVEWFEDIEAKGIVVERHNGNSWRGTALIPDGIGHMNLASQRGVLTTAEGAEDCESIYSP
jgi:SAM-dependent methyltransferase